MKYNNRFLIIFFITLVTCLSVIKQSHAFFSSEDVIAPSKNNVFTLSIKNIGSETLDGVNLSTSIARNPDGLITVKQTTPQNVSIDADATQEFEITFDVGCPPEGVSKTEIAKFKFSLTTSSEGPFYIEGCGIDTNDCEGLEAEFTVLEEHDACKECTDGELEDKDCDDNDDCTIDSCISTFNIGCVHIRNPFCDDIDNSDPTYIQADRSTDAPEVINETTFYFSPTSSPQIKDTLALSHSLNHKSLVDIIIFDSNKTVVKNLITRKRRDSGDHVEVWDGMDNNEQILPDGIYLYNIVSARIRNPLKTSVSNGKIIIDNVLPSAEIHFIKANATKTNTYSVFGTVSDEYFKDYQLDCYSDKTFSRIASNSQVVIDDELGSFDTTTFEDGSYTFRLTANDYAGNTVTYEMPFTLDKTTEILKINIDSVVQTPELGSEGYVQTSDDPTVWIEDEIPEGSTELETWEWNSDIAYSGRFSHTDPIMDGTHGHYFIHANDTLSLSYRDNIIQYVYLDPLNPPQQIMLQFYTGDGTTAHRAYWGNDRIQCGRIQRSSELYRLGYLPPTGKWIRLKIPASTVGLSGQEIKGMAFITYDGRAYWDKTTKSSGLNENQRNSWFLASQIGDDDSTSTTITYSMSKSANLVLSIFDSQNQAVKTLIDEYKTAGTYQVNWDSKYDNGVSTVPNGTYYFQFESPDGPVDSNAYALLPGDWSALSANVQTHVTDSDGNQYSINSNTVQKYNTSDILMYTVTARTLGLDIVSPTSINIDSNDNLFLIDSSSQKLFKLNPYGHLLNVLPYPSEISWADQSITINDATGLKVDNDGHFIVANQNGSEMIKLAVGRGVIDLTNITAEIRVPYENSMISYSVPIIGTAAARNFSEYRVEYGLGTSPTEWTSINTSRSETFDDHEPIPPSRTIYGNLATWHTAELVGWAGAGDTYRIPMGTYTIRLTVFNNAGEYKQDSVVVEMSKLIGSWRGTLISDDGLVQFKYPSRSIPDDYDLFSIKPLDTSEAPAVDDPELTLVGKIYQIKPAGYQFLKTCTLKMYYTDEQVGQISEDTLKIYRWNPIIQKWIFVYADLDTDNNVLSTTLTEFNSYKVYYAVISDPPPAPILFQPASPTNLRYISVFGNASPSVNVELFVNSISQGTVQADENTGNFLKNEVLLKLGTNQITAIASDPVGNSSPLSEPVTVEMALAQPVSVTSLDFKNSSFTENYTQDVSIGDELYIELVGEDADTENIDSTVVILKSSITEPTGVTILLLETTENSGIYQGAGIVGELSDPSTGTVAASQVLQETISVVSQVNPDKNDSINMVDITPPPAPEITSTTHPSLCQNTFEVGLDEWANMSNDFGATVIQSSENVSSGNYSVKLINEQEGGDFAALLRSTAFDSQIYPIISFDYKIPADLKLNLVALVNGMQKEIIFTDDPKTVETFEDDLYRPIGQIENIVADNTWQHAEFNLYNMLKADDPDKDTFIVEEIYFADYNLPGWLELVMGNENPAGSHYFVDNFIISQGGKSNNDPVFNWTIDDSGVTGYSYELDQTPGSIPDQVSEGAAQTKSYSDIADGIWYFHVRAVDSGGNWGITNHYRIKVDATGPVASSPDPPNGTSSGNLEAKITITDNAGSGVNPDTIQLQINDTVYDSDDGGIVYDELTGVMTFSLWKVSPTPDPWVDGDTIQARLIAASDFAGNALQSEYLWSWTVDYSELTGGYLSLLTTQGGQTPSWSPDETKIVFMSERTGNADIWIIDSNDYAEQQGTVTQLTNYTSNESHPSWSPVDNRIAFVSDQTGVDKIFVIQSDGTNLIQITTGTDEDSHPSWSPDGSQIVFSRLDEIWIAEADGSQVSQITSDSVEYYLEPVWAKSGESQSKIVFTKSLYVDEVAVMASDGSDQEIITESGSDFLPTWSESTNQVVFVTTRDNLTQAIRIVNHNGSNEAVYIDNESRFWDTEPDISAISQNIALQSTRNGTWNIWVKTQLQIIDVRAFPENFSPNGDGIKDTVDIVFNIIGGSASVDIGIYDFEDNLVLMLAEDELYYSLNTVTWNGQDTNENIVDDGVYTYKISVEEANIEKTGTIDIDNSAPFFTNWSILEQDLTQGEQSISVTVADSNNITSTRLQYGVGSTEQIETPDIIGWTDFSEDTNGTLDLVWENYDGDYLFVRGYAEDNQGNIGYSDLQSQLIAYAGAPPVANAGTSYSIEEGDTAILNGSASYDTDGQIVSYAWMQTDGQPEVTLSNVSGITTTFVTPSVESAGVTLTFQLTVQDNQGYESTSEISVIITDNGITGFPVNALPVQCATGLTAGIQMQGAGELTSLSFIDPATIPDSSEKPESMIYGLFNMEVKINTGGTAQITYYLSEALPPEYCWYKLDSEGNWYNFDQYVQYNNERTTATLTIVDGGQGDDDGIANGVIVDPSGPGFVSIPASPENVMVKAIPTLNEWGMILFSVILLLCAHLTLRKNRYSYRRNLKNITC